MDKVAHQSNEVLMKQRKPQSRGRNIKNGVTLEVQRTSPKNLETQIKFESLNPVASLSPPNEREGVNFKSKASFFKTEQGYFPNNKSSAVDSFIEQEPKHVGFHESVRSSHVSGSAANDFKKRFEGLEFIDQAKVMRMTLDGKRFDRFMNLYDQRKTDMQKRIKKMGHHPLSKSVKVDNDVK